MRVFKLATLTESPSFERADKEVKAHVLSVLRQAPFEVQQQALRLAESATKGGEVAAILQYLSILNSPSYFSRSCRITDHPTVTAIPLRKQDKLAGLKPASQILEIIARFPDGICRQGILAEFAKIGIEKHEASIRDILARLRRKQFIYWEPRSSTGRKGQYHVYFLMPVIELYPTGKLESASIKKIKELVVKGYSVTEIALRCGLSRDFVAAECAKRSKRRAS